MSEPVYTQETVNQLVAETLVENKRLRAERDALENWIRRHLKDVEEWRWGIDAEINAILKDAEHTATALEDGG